jgi:hypothetical protein
MTKHFSIILLLVFLALPELVNAQSTVHMTVHRENAGALNEHGWITAESTEGKFAVELPSPFNDATVSDKEPSPVLKAYSIGTTTPDNIRFLATRISYRTPGHASSILDRLENGEGVPEKVLGIDKLQHLGFRAVSMMIWKPGTFFAQQTHLVGEDTVTLMIEGPIEKIDSLKATGNHFFDSLRIQ